MKGKQQIIKDVKDTLDNMLDTPIGRAQQEGIENLSKNLHKMLDYAEENDKWDEYCWGSSESVLYTAMFVLCSCYIERPLNVDVLDNPENFYNFVRDWFKEHVNHYRLKVEKGRMISNKMDQAMGADCAKEILEILTEDEDD